MAKGRCWVDILEDEDIDELPTSWSCPTNASPGPH